MSRLLINVLLLLLWTIPAHAQFTAIQRASNGDTSLSFGVAPTSGNIVVVCGRWEGASGTGNLAVAQGGNTFTMLTRVDNASGDHHAQCGYFIGVSTTNTFTLTYPASHNPVLVAACAVEIDPTTGAATFDTSGSNSAASGTAITTGNITLNATATHWMVVAFGSSYSGGQTFSSRTINGVAPGGSVDDPAQPWSTLFDRAVTASFTGGGAVTASANDAWIGLILAFKEGTASAAPEKKRRIVY